MSSISKSAKLMANAWILLSTVFLIALFVGCKGQSGGLNLSPTAPATVPGNLPAGSGPQNSYAEVVTRVAPAVVTVRSTERAREATQFPFMNDPFRDFFGDRTPSQQEPPQRVQGIGSGVIVSPDGYILTNHHVVDGALEIKIETTDNRTFTAKLVGSDPPSDLAVLKIDAREMPVLALGDSDRVRVGDVVLAIGNPLGIGQTVTSGIISAKGRATGLSDGSFEDFLQTDAAINRGNSGGALVNTVGELIGINSQILSPSGGSIGIGFAIPSNMARAVMDQLLKTGKVRRGMIGVTIQSVNADLAQSMNLATARGAIVTSVQSGGPGERAGIKRGDVITAVNGQAIIDSNNLRNMVASSAPGSEVTLTVLRDGRELTIKVSLGELPVKTRQEDQQGSNEQPQGVDKFGLSLQPLTPEVAARLGLGANEQGLVVTALDPNGVAADAGINQGDVIQEVNRQPVRNLGDFNVAIARSGSRPALVLVNRRGSVVYLTLRPRP
ncbi:MAG TPA: DegQ family serine endoprotease [Pyrinomonadaceae bacterium]